MTKRKRQMSLKEIAKINAEQHRPSVPEFRTVTIPRLYIWIPREGWRPAAIAGTQWDAEQWRIQYRARNICTLIIKDPVRNAA